MGKQEGEHRYMSVKCMRFEGMCVCELIAHVFQYSKSTKNTVLL